MMNRDGSGLRLFSADATDPAWSPDSRRLAFVGRYDTPTLSGIVSVANIDGARRRELDKRQQVVRPRWSTDASLLAYTLPSGHSSVRVVRVSDGRRVAALTRAAGPAWGRGRQLAFIRHLDNREVLALWDKGHMRVLATSAAGITTPTWSPDGRKLAFATSGAAAAIGVVRADRGRARMFGLPTAGSHTGTDVTDIIWEGGGKLVVAGRHYGIPGPALGGWRGACGVRLSTV